MVLTQLIEAVPMVLTQLIEASPLFPVGRQSSCVVHQRRPLPVVHVLQVHHQLVVLRLFTSDDRESKMDDQINGSQVRTSQKEDNRSYTASILTVRYCRCRMNDTSTQMEYGAWPFNNL